jgi:23S rRNA pseudouridine2604 synthase
MDFKRLIAHNAIMNEPVRINKYLAERGLASRREADALIEAGQVLVNGKSAELGQKVTLADKVEIVGKQKEKKYLAYYKARGVISHSPSEGEVDIETQLKHDHGISDVHPVGRLDKDSEGLIILSNDGLITGPLLDPEAKHEKEYEVTVDKDINSPFLKRMATGVDIEGYLTKPAKAEPQKGAGKKRFLLTITEGKKHQIRRMCAALGYQVQTLKRIRIANIELKNLKPNQYRNITDTELDKLLSELGIKNST